MAFTSRNPSVSDGKNCLTVHPQHWDKTSLIETPDAIRILLFKECRLRDRQLIFDSLVHQNEVQKSSVSSKDEFSHLTEMIFGSTAMKYHDTYYKIHNVSSPGRLIFTQVFSTPMKRCNTDSSFSKCSSSCSNYDLSTNSLSQASMDSRIDSFSFFRKNNWAPSNSTSTTIDSGFSESNFSSRSSFQRSSGSFTRSEGLEPSSTSLNIYNSFLNDSESQKMTSKNSNYSKLGLALILPISTKTDVPEHIYFEHITFIESMLWRIRQYVELALKSPKFFFVSMLEISSILAKWMSRELNFWTKKRDGFYEADGNYSKKISLLNLRKSIFFRREHKNENFEKFCRTLKELDVKETKFFLSALVTAVLTHHTGWVASCYSLKELDFNDSYNAIWKQLTDLYGASGYLTKTSKTVIYGLKNNTTIKNVVDFLGYFIRYFRVKRRYVERDNLLEENKIVDHICDNIFKQDSHKIIEYPITKQDLFKTQRVREDLAQMVHFKEERNNNKINQNNVMKLKGLHKTKTLDQGLCSLKDMNDELELGDKDEYESKPVLFILGDSDKLQNLKKSDVKDDKHLVDITNMKKNENPSRGTSTLKVIKFPLPKEKPCGEFIEITPSDFFSENILLDTYVPEQILQATNILEKTLKNHLINDLSLKNSCLFPNQVDENVAILGNTDKWEVQVWSSSRNGMVRHSSDTFADSSPLVSNMLEVVLEMWKLNMSKEQCSSFMEQRLVEICLKAKALSQFLLTTDFCTIETLLSTLKLEVVDVPLLMSVGANIDPEVMQKYGISYQ